MNSNDTPEISIRGYELGDELRIVDFLNLCYQTNLNDLESWQWSHSDYPTFRSDYEFIVEAGGEMVSYRAMYLRDMIIHGNRFTSAALGATATRPDFRGRGIYSRLHQLTLERAVAQNAAIAVTGNSRGSITYRNNLKTGFAGIRSYSYIKMVNPCKVLEVELRKLFKGDSRIGALLNEQKQDLFFEIDKQIISLAEIADGYAFRSGTNRRQIVIRVSEDAVPLLLVVKKGSVPRKLGSILRLVLYGKVRLRFGSPLALIRLLHLVVRVVFK